MLAAVQTSYLALYYASYELKNDKEVVLAAVQENGYALKWASDALKNDKDVMFAAATAKKYNIDALFLKMLPSIWESMQAYMINGKRFYSMEDNEKAAYCAELDKFERIYISLRQTADRREMDERSSEIEETLNEMESSLAFWDTNPCLQWDFEKDFEQGMFI